jgi:RNA polymerase primary sigma factor
MYIGPEQVAREGGRKMKEKDMYEALADMGKRRGSVTYAEINEALPSEFFSLDELEKFMGHLRNIGVKVVPGESSIN